MNRNKLVVSLIFSGVSMLLLNGCSEFMRAVDDVNAGMGGQRTCKYESAKETNSYKGYSVTLGGYCNYWESEIRNYSNRSIKCTFNNGNGNYITSSIVSPNQNKEITVGSMYSHSKVNYSCKTWSEAVSTLKRSKGLVLEKKIERGNTYYRVKNDSSSKRTCYIKLSSSSSHLLSQKIAGYRWTSWQKIPSGKITYGCKVIKVDDEAIY